jgi:hypothetical protein
MRSGTNSHSSVASAAWTASASATSPLSLRRTSRIRSVGNASSRSRRLVELAQACQVLLRHALALLCHLLIKPLDLLVVGIREIDAVSG